MELRYRREASVGLLLIVAAAIFVFLLIWLRGKSLRSGQLIEIAFDDVSGLKVGDPVRTSGVPVGQVNDIRLVAPGRVEVTLKLHSAPTPRRDARATVRLLDFFGARYVDYQPGTAAAPLPADSEIHGEKEQDLTALAQGLSGEARQALSNAAQVLGPENTRELHRLLADARTAVSRLGTAADSGGQQAVGALEALRSVLQHLDLLVGGEAANQTFDNMRDASRNLAQVTATLQTTTSSLDSILQKINRGQGSVGRMVNDTTLVADLHAASTALTALLTDLKAHPGRYVQVRIF
jgi:phospholipid/cholesterol/gamma-HCH transport system substrate-binding protein